MNFSKNEFVRPDIVVSGSNTSLEIKLIENDLPSLEFDVELYKTFKKEKSVSQKIKDKVHEAKWFIKAVETRNKNVSKIGSLVRDEVMATVLELLGEDTGEDTGDVLDPTEPLMEAGLDSLAATQLVRSLSDSLEVELSPTVLFDHPTVDALVAHVVETVSGLDNEALDRSLGSELIRRNSRLEKGLDGRDIAVVGMSCRFPGGIEGPAMFWDALQAGRIMTGKVPWDRWDVDALVASSKGMSREVADRVKYGGFVEDLDMFDASAFRISAAEASAMDPQQRLLLEYAELAFADAGYDRVSLEGEDVGVFIGIGGSDASGIAAQSDKLSVYSAHGTSFSAAAAAAWAPPAPAALFAIPFATSIPTSFA